MTKYSAGFYHVVGHKNIEKGTHAVSSDYTYKEDNYQIERDKAWTHYTQLVEDGYQASITLFKNSCEVLAQTKVEK